MAAADRLLDYKSAIISREDKRLIRNNGKNAPTKTNIGKTVIPNNERKNGCFICQSPYYARDCQRNES